MSPTPQQTTRRVLVTGAAGSIGTAFWQRRHGEFSLRLADLHTPFQDHPLALDRFPSGSLMVLPPHLRPREKAR